MNFKCIILKLSFKKHQEHTEINVFMLDLCCLFHLIFIFIVYLGISGVFQIYVAYLKSHISAS